MINCPSGLARASKILSSLLFGGGIGALPSCDEEDEAFEDQLINKRKEKRRIVYYDPNCSEPLWELGMVFKNAAQLKDAVMYYAVKKQIHIKFNRNDAKKIRVTCKYVDKRDNSKCPWLLYASQDRRTGNLVIRHYKPVHKCLKQHTNPHCNTKFIAKFLREDIIKTPNIKPWMMQETLKNKLEVYKHRSVCRRARDMVLKEITGDYTEEFRRLYDYRDIILSTNPGSTCEVEVDIVGEDKIHTFKSFYICFHALKEGFKRGCRKFIGVDGCFLKGAFKGQLLVAVGKNGNNEIYPVAWAVVHNETTESWSWFLQLLRQDLNLGRGKGLALITDMQKGLENAIVDVLPEAEHRECARHIIANWAKKWRGVERRKCFRRCAKSTFEAELIKNLKEMEKLGGEEICSDLLRYNIKRWSRMYFSAETCCDSCDNNVSETFNSMILGARYKSIVSMLEEIRTETMRRHVKFKFFPEKWRSDISPMAYNILEKNNTRSMQCSIIWNADNGFEILDGEFRHVVNLNDNTCTCNAWKLKGIPCAHAISAMHDMGLDPQNYVSKWYHKDTYLQAYSVFIQPMPNLNVVAESSNPPIMAPPIKPLPGRPKKNRRKPFDELKKFGKASKAGCTMTCSWCKEPDHNKRNCPVRKEGKPQVIKENVVQSNKRSKSASVAKNMNTTNEVESSSKKRKTGIKASGSGVFISENTGGTCEQRGRLDFNTVISTAKGPIIDSSVVTGDLGFKPKTTTWKGKLKITTRKVRKQMTTGDSTQRPTQQSQVNATQITEAQRKRAAASRELAEKRLAERRKLTIGASQPTQSVTGSTLAKNSSSQPNPPPLWKI